MSIRTLVAVSTRALVVCGALTALLAAPAYAQATAPAAQATPPIAVPAPLPLPLPPLATMTAADMFYTGVWGNTHWRATEAIGMSIHNRADEKVGDVQELLIDGNGQVLAAIVGVGGFLGMGERDVAVSYRALEMTRVANGKARLVLDVDKATLLKAPLYKQTITAKSN